MWAVKCWRVPVLLAAFLHGAWAAHAAPPPARAGGDKTITNEAGQPILVNGERINYRREELRQAPAPKARIQTAGAGLAAPPAGQLAGWGWATLGVNIGAVAST